MEIKDNRKTVQINPDVHQNMINHVGNKLKIGAWTEEAITEKIRREKLQSFKLKEILKGEE